MSTFTAPNAYPAASALDLWLGRSTVEKEHWLQLARRHNHIYKFRRSTVFSFDMSKYKLGSSAIFGTTQDTLGPWETSTAPGTAPVICIPGPDGKSVDNALFAPDDFDANVDVTLGMVYEQENVTSSLVWTFGSGTPWTFTHVGVQAALYAESTIATPKNVIGNEFKILAGITAGAGLFKLHWLFARFAAQGSIG